MEVGKLVPIVLLFILCGLLLGVGILTFDKFDRAVRTTTTVVSTGLNLSKAGTTTFAQTYCLAVVSVANSTTTYDIAVNNVTFSVPDTCTLTWSRIAGCGNALGGASDYCNVTYTYGLGNPATTALAATSTAISPVATTWMPLIVTVVILAIILGLVIQSFAMKDRE